MSKKSPQLQLFKNEPKEYGGILRNKLKGRGSRPLSTKNTMHVVLRSTLAKGEWAFNRAQNKRKISAIIVKFSHKYGVGIVSLANVGNHLHFHIKLSNRYCYKPFIRAITAAIAMAVTGISRWKRLSIKFWDRRPYTRIVYGLRGFAVLQMYVRVNQLEGMGYSREAARQVILWEQAARGFS